MSEINDHSNDVNFSEDDLLIEKFVANKITPNELAIVKKKVAENPKFAEDLKIRAAMQKAAIQKLIEDNQEEMELALTQMTEEYNEEMNRIKGKMEKLAVKYANNQLTQGEVKWLIHQYKEDDAVFEIFGIDEHLATFIENQASNGKTLKENASKLFENLIHELSQIVSPFQTPKTAYRSTEQSNFPTVNTDSLQEAYENKDYSSFIQQYEGSDKNVQQHLDLNYAYAHYQLGNNQQAKAVYHNRLLQEDEEGEENQARWYLALILLEEKDLEAVKPHLEILANDYNEFVQTKAKELLAHINS